jgi:Protein of unknown function (DUF3866)
MLKLRRAVVLEVLTAPEHPLAGADQAPAPSRAAAEQRLVIELRGAEGGGDAAPGAGGRAREAIADVGLLGSSEVGDELIVNVEAQDIGLGSGGFDVVHVNLSRGLGAAVAGSAHVMKLNYTSLQHTVEPVEEAQLRLPVARPVAVLALHGQLAAVAFAFARGAPGCKLGYVQTEGGALPGGHSRTVGALRRREMLVGHLTAGAAHGGEGEAITTIGALHHGLSKLGWHAAVCGPGPGIVGSSSPLGHGGMSALDSAHAALALGAPTVLVARMSSGDARARHRGISHHTMTVLDLLLGSVSVALPAGMRTPIGSELRAGLGSVFGGAMPGGAIEDRPGLSLDVERPARITRHDWRRAEIDLPAFAASGLSAETMGRGLTEDPLFFGAALAGGAALAEAVLQHSGAGSRAGKPGGAA